MNILVPFVENLRQHFKVKGLAPKATQLLRIKICKDALNEAVGICLSDCIVGESKGQPDPIIAMVLLAWVAVSQLRR